jgi:hypothetical protein
MCRPADAFTFTSSKAVTDYHASRSRFVRDAIGGAMIRRLDNRAVLVWNSKQL